MRTGRPKAPLILNREERRELESLAHRSRSVPALARRARIVLACAEGQDNKGVAHRLRATPATVGKWRTRFVRERLAGLYDEPRPGAPRSITDDEIEQVVVRTLESTPRGCCRCGPASPSGGRTTTSAMAPPRCLPRSTPRAAK